MNVRKHLEGKVAEAVVKAVRDPSTDATMNDAKPITDAIVQQALPELINAANKEPWYQSNVTMAALLTIILRLLAHYGYAIPPELHGDLLTVIVKFGPEAAGLWVLAGRWIFSKPLGEGPILGRIRRLFGWKGGAT